MSSSTDDTLKHAVVGAVVSLVTFFLPFSPAIGGAVAGYLHGPDRGAGARVGGLSGVIAAVPGALLAALIAAVFVSVGPGGRSRLLVAVVFLVLLAATALYGGAFGAAGGFVGALLDGEFDGPTETSPERLAATRDAADGSVAGDPKEPDPDPTEFDERVDDRERG